TVRRSTPELAPKDVFYFRGVEMKIVKYVAPVLVSVGCLVGSAAVSAQIVAHSLGDNTDISPEAAGWGQIAGTVGFNHEGQIAAQCVAEYGVSYAGGGCIAATLTAEELNKCLSVGVGGDGCFGDNNTLVDMVRANVEAAQQETGAVNQTIRATVGVSVKDIEDNGIFGGSNSVFNCPFGGC
ncbi:hypothetical protein, partial [Paraburkholderia strydomiana]